MKKDNPKNYGIKDIPPCKACGGRMSLIRRSPHPDSPAEIEIQFFECGACSSSYERLANPDGAMFPYDLQPDPKNPPRNK